MSVFCGCMYDSNYVRGQMCTFLGASKPKEAAPCSSAAGNTGPPEEVTGRSQPRSVMNTPYYPSFSASSGWTEQERDDGGGWVEQKKVHTPLWASSCHSDFWRLTLLCRAGDGLLKPVRQRICYKWLVRCRLQLRNVECSKKLTFKECWIERWSRNAVTQ